MRASPGAERMGMEYNIICGRSNQCVSAENERRTGEDAEFRRLSRRDDEGRDAGMGSLYIVPWFLTR